jgi:hypothetical protein
LKSSQSQKKLKTDQSASKSKSHSLVPNKRSKTAGKQSTSRDKNQAVPRRDSASRSTSQKKQEADKKMTKTSPDSVYSKSYQYKKGATRNSRSPGKPQDKKKGEPK